MSGIMTVLCILKQNIDLKLFTHALAEWCSYFKKISRNYSLAQSTQLLWVGSGKSTLTQTIFGIKWGLLLFLEDVNTSTCSALCAAVHKEYGGIQDASLCAYLEVTFPFPSVYKSSEVWCFYLLTTTLISTFGPCCSLCSPLKFEEQGLRRGCLTAFSSCCLVTLDILMALLARRHHLSEAAQERAPHPQTCWDHSWCLKEIYQCNSRDGY